MPQPASCPLQYSSIPHQRSPPRSAERITSSLSVGPDTVTAELNQGSSGSRSVGQRKRVTTVQSGGRVVEHLRHSRSRRVVGRSTHRTSRRIRQSDRGPDRTVLRPARRVRRPRGMEWRRNPFLPTMALLAHRTVLTHRPRPPAHRPCTHRTATPAHRIPRRTTVVLESSRTDPRRHHRPRTRIAVSSAVSNGGTGRAPRSIHQTRRPPRRRQRNETSRIRRPVAVERRRNTVGDHAAATHRRRPTSRRHRAQ